MAIEAIRSPRTVVVRPVRSIKLLLVDPDTFFERKSEGVGLKYELLLLLVVGLVGTALLAYSVDFIVGHFRAGTAFAGAQHSNKPILPRAISRQLWGTVAHPLAGAYLLWVLYSVGFFFVSWFFNGRGSILKVAKLTAWGFVPLAIANLIHYGSWAVATTYVELETEIRGTGDSGKVAFLLNELRNEPIAIGATVVGILLVLWSAYLLVFAVKHSRSLSKEDAMKTVAVVAAVHVAYLVWSLLGHTVLSPL